MVHRKAKNETTSAGDLNIQIVLAFAFRAWKWIAFYVVLAAGLTIWRDVVNPPVTIYSVFLIESSRSNTLQAVTERISGGTSLIADDRDERIAKYLMILNSHMFMDSVADSMRRSKDFEHFKRAIAPSFPEGTSESDIRTRLADFLRASTTFSKFAREAIRITTVLPKAQDVLFLGNFVDEAVENALADRDTNDLLAGRDFLESQLLEIGGRLSKLDEEIVSKFGGDRLAAFNPAAAKEAASGARINELEAKIITLKIQMNENEALLQEARSQVESSPGGGAAYGAYNDKYSPQTVYSSLQRKNQSLQLELNSHKEMLATLKEKELVQPADQNGLADLTKKKEMQYQLYSEVARQIMALDVQKISIKSKIRALEKAWTNVGQSVTLVPDLLNRSVLALLLACLTVYLLESLQPRLRAKKDLEAMGIQYLGSIPDLTRLDQKLSLRSLLNGDFLANRRRGAKSKEAHSLDIKPDSFYDRVFGHIRTNMAKFSAQADRRHKVISIMGAHSGDGKSSLASNLAKSLAMGGTRVLLIDCDLRRRTLTQALGYGTQPGLAEYLLAPESEFGTKMVRKLAKNLEMLPAGRYRTNAADLLYSAQFEEVIEALGRFYDFIILDTPPAALYSEVIPISAASDLIILSLTVRKTSLASVGKVIEKLHVDSKGPVAYVINKDEDIDFNAYYSQPPQSSASDAARTA